MGYFDWTDYFRLAVRLINSAGEAENRSAVSRSYYAAYNQWKDHAVSSGASIPGTADAHKKLVEWLESNGQPVVARKLRRLRTLRNRADYDGKHMTAKDSVLAVNMARALLSRWMP